MAFDILRPIIENPSARLRLIAFHHAGGNAYSFRPFAPQMPEDVELLAVQFPGREGSAGPRAARQMDELLDHICPAIATVRPPFAFFGHSLGSLVAFEVTRRLRATDGPLPLHVFSSANRAPTVSNRSATAYADGSDQDLLGWIRAQGGAPQAVLDEPEYLRILLPILRADLALLGNYSCEEQPPLDVPWTTYRGTDDTLVSAKDLTAWSGVVVGPVRSRTFPGGHFYWLNAGQSFFSVFRADLEQVSAD